MPSRIHMAATKARREVLRVLVKTGLASPYQPEFFAGFAQESRRSAAVIVPMVVDLLAPASVVDVGCGTGEWLAEFASAGVRDFLGIDGHAPPAQLQVPPDRFVTANLSGPLPIQRRFDLALSLEVAEHLPPAAAEQFVASLTTLAGALLFSAAIPHQGGTGHLHERWPSYWAGLFTRRGYRPIDCIRPRVWSDDRVCWWYAQNTILYADDATIRARPRLAELAARTEWEQLNLVHPRVLERLAKRAGR